MFTSHLREVNETYFSHGWAAVVLAARAAVVAVVLVVHAVLPFVFTRTGSGMIAALHADMLRRAAPRPRPSTTRDSGAGGGVGLPSLAAASALPETRQT